MNEYIFFPALSGVEGYGFNGEVLVETNLNNGLRGEYL
jgi:hypothetical protein